MNVRIVLAATIGYVAGAASTIFVFAPFHARPNLGDVPAWLAVFIAAIGGYVALRQFREQQGQFAAEARRNEKRDILLDTHQDWFSGPTKSDSNIKFLVRFIDDSGARWQLDENMHLEAPPDSDW